MTRSIDSLGQLISRRVVAGMVPNLLHSYSWYNKLTLSAKIRSEVSVADNLRGLLKTRCPLEVIQRRHPSHWCQEFGVGPEVRTIMPQNKLRSKLRGN